MREETSRTDELLMRWRRGGEEDRLAGRWPVHTALWGRVVMQLAIPIRECAYSRIASGANGNVQTRFLFGSRQEGLYSQSHDSG